MTSQWRKFLELFSWLCMLAHYLLTACMTGVWRSTKGYGILEWLETLTLLGTKLIGLRTPKILIRV